MPRESPAAERDTVQRHFRLGWTSLLVFLSLGVALEAMHGLKIGFYLDVTNATRRLMWTLAHAHGTLLSLIHIAFAATLASGAASWNAGALRRASGSLIGAGLVLPAGFFLGGVVVHDGDPSLGILLVPVGAVLLFIAVWLTRQSIRRKNAEP